VALLSVLRPQRRDGRVLRFVVALLVLSVATAARAGELRAGDLLPAATLADWQGGSVDLDAWRGRVVIIDFWASWCQVCRAALPELDAISRRHASEGLVVLAVNIDKQRTPAERFLSEYLPEPAVTLLRDPEGALFARFGAQGMPALYVVDRAGVVRLAESGYSPQRLPNIERAVNALLGDPTARPDYADTPTRSSDTLLGPENTRPPDQKNTVNPPLTQNGLPGVK